LDRLGRQRREKGFGQLRTEERLRQLEAENERLRGDLKTLSRRFSHDMRTPLNCVAMAGEELSKPSSGSEAAQAALAPALLGAVTEITSLIERVSFVLKASVDPPPRQTLAMGDAVWAALQRLETRTREQGATIVQPDSWPRVEGMASWLEVIWGNLIGNALKYGGKAPRIELDWVQGSPEYFFRVRDHGPGVPPEKRGQLFTPFNALHALSAPRGLGLPIVHRLVELQGGRCFFEAPTDGGAYFVFTLPALA
jgi:K+-sensing histidine kinase KdpD